MTTLEQAARQALEANRALREWINAVPKETALPPMPGIDGDWLDSVDSELREALEQPTAKDCLKVEPKQEPSTQATTCAECGKHKDTPLRVDAMGGYVCLTCIDKKLCSLLGELGYSKPEQDPIANVSNMVEQPKQEPVQEPVVWTWDTKNQRDGFLDAHFQFSKPESHSLIMNLRPLYTEPPQRKPLDIQRIKHIATYCGEHITDEDVIEITRRVEAAHGIKG